MTSKIAKTPPLIALLLFACAGILCADNITKATYGLYSDTYEGANIASNDNSDPDSAYFGVWPSTSTAGVTLADTPSVAVDTVTFSEGSKSFRLATSTRSTGGFYITLSTSPFLKRNRDFTSYGVGGSFEFDIKLDSVTKPTTPSDVHFKVEWSENSADGTDAQSDNPANLSNFLVNSTTVGWQHCSISFSTISMTIDPPPNWEFVNDSIGPDGYTCLCVVGLWAEPTKQFWIDNLVIKSTSTGSMALTVKNISDNSVVTGSSVTWSTSTITLGSTKWQVADQYIQVAYDYFDTGWGMQLYTSNTSAGANPAYTGVANPAGLVNTSTTTKTLSLAWRVADSTLTATDFNIQQNGGSLYVGDPGFHCFLWMVDNSTGAFNGADYATPWDKQRGIQYAESTWGAAKSPNYIYIAADFTTAVTPTTYKTNKLKLELFHE